MLLEAAQGPDGVVASHQIDPEEMAARMLQDPSLQSMTPKLAKAMAAWNQKFRNEKAVVVQAQTTQKPEPSAGSGGTKEPGGWAGSSTAARARSRQNDRKDPLSSSEEEVAIANERRPRSSSQKETGSEAKGAPNRANPNAETTKSPSACDLDVWNDGCMVGQLLTRPCRSSDATASGFVALWLSANRKDAPKRERGRKQCPRQNMLGNIPPRRKRRSSSSCSRSRRSRHHRQVKQPLSGLVAATAATT